MYTQDEIKSAWLLANKFGIKYFGAVGTNSKTLKSDKKTEYLTFISYLAPSDQSGKYNVCPFASEGCRNACLFTAGRGQQKSVKEARIRRTNFWFEHREAFKTCLFDEIDKHYKHCVKIGKRAAARINGTSDIILERMYPELFEWFKDVQFYDYSPNMHRFMPTWKLPKNYHLTFSKKEDNDDAIDKIIKVNPKINIAVVFDELPKKYLGRRVINGDDYDARFLDPPGVIVGLKQKGDAKKDTSGFVVRTTNLTIKGKELVSV